MRWLVTLNFIDGPVSSFQNFFPEAFLASSSGVGLMPSAEVDDDGPEVGAGGTYCSCCWPLGGHLASLNTSLNLASCLRVSVLHRTCSLDMHTIRNAGGSVYKNIGSIDASNSTQYRLIATWCVSNSTHRNAANVLYVVH